MRPPEPLPVRVSQTWIERGIKEGTGMLAYVKMMGWEGYEDTNEDVSDEELLFRAISSAIAEICVCHVLERPFVSKIGKPRRTPDIAPDIEVRCRYPGRGGSDLGIRFRESMTKAEAPFVLVHRLAENHNLIMGMLIAADAPHFVTPSGHNERLKVNYIKPGVLYSPEHLIKFWHARCEED